jgi:hypothetical protein
MSLMSSSRVADKDGAKTRQEVWAWLATFLDELSRDAVAAHATCARKAMCYICFGAHDQLHVIVSSDGMRWRTDMSSPLLQT